MNQTVSVIIMYVVVLAALFVPTYLSNKKKKQKQQEMMDNLKVGDKITTIGGIKGEIAQVLTETVEIKIDRTARMTILKSAISNVSK